MSDDDAQTPLHRPLLEWWAQFGRKDLPWQRDPEPYRVWVSEIMLQQTQVATVLRYYDNFIAHFASVEALAGAPLDRVLAQWSGLGYYSRARNLHRAAQQVVELHGGALPADRAALEALPGVGRSTAAAVLSLAHGQRAAILDGNVKRVLCRLHAIERPPREAATLRRLWELAESHTPAERCAHYSQAIMDLGATLCTRARPQCLICPLRDRCRALAEGRPAHYPVSAGRKSLPERAVQLLLAQSPEGAILLTKRPAEGVWGGLWSLPEFTDRAALCHYLARQQLGLRADMREQPGFRHTFSHYHLDITPVLAPVRTARVPMTGAKALWYKGGMPPGGLSAPIARLLAQHLEEPIR